MALIKKLLETTQTIAIVGLSNNQNKASYQVAEFMQNHGYTIVPVNPIISESKSKPGYWAGHWYFMVLNVIILG